MTFVSSISLSDSILCEIVIFEFPVILYYLKTDSDLYAVQVFI